MNKMPQVENYFKKINNFFKITFFFLKYQIIYSAKKKYNLFKFNNLFACRYVITDIMTKERHDISVRHCKN